MVGDPPGDRPQAQPVRLPLPGGALVQGEHLGPRDEFAGELHDGEPDPVLVESVQRKILQAARWPTPITLRGLANLHALEHRIFGNAGESTLLTIDIGRFTEINDTFGRGLGDQVLVAVADRLRTVIRCDFRRCDRRQGSSAGGLRTGRFTLRSASVSTDGVTHCGVFPRRLIDWCNTVGVGTAFIDPGSPWQNGFVESFNAQFRREQLSGEIMDTMGEATYLAEEWKAIYNHERPHGPLDGSWRRDGAICMA